MYYRKGAPESSESGMDLLRNLQKKVETEKVVALA
jgi:hypothetical protein